MIHYVDSHAHIPICKESVGDIIEEAVENHFDRIMNVGYDLASSEASLHLAKTFEWIDASFGIHPHYLNMYEKEIDTFLQTQRVHKEYRAVGEIGMDTVKSQTDLSLQRLCFTQQVDFAIKHQYPIIVHNREADEEVYEVLKQFPGIRGVMHCYSSDRKMAEKYLNIGLFLSFSGNITYKRSSELREVVKMVPIDRLLLETDCPYLTPLPYRGKTLNRPVYVKEVYKEAATLKNISLEVLSERLMKNYYTLFLGG
ncbi:MAG: TatD family hydrolase [Caldisericia bacterium]|nr:TatD family hydrolase [Caldisericia bacterium]MDD4613968.1 TatD family hydrolase [Caldisericia bacterium]